MRKVMRKHGQRKPEVRLSAQAVEAVEDLDARVEMIQALIPMGLRVVVVVLQRAVEELAGPRYRRGPEDHDSISLSGVRSKTKEDLPDSISPAR